jgi:peptide/nickel transport system permease protein
MGRYLIRRLLQGLLVLFGVTLVVFVVIHLVPGDPGRAILGPKASPAAVNRLNEELGLNQSLPAQYLEYLGNLLRGDLGHSITSHVSVGHLIGPRVLPSLALVAFALTISLLLAVPLAILSALRANRLPDHLIRSASVLMYAIPSFWLGLMLAVLFGLQLGIFPTSGFDDSFPSGLIQTLTLPAVTVAFITTPVILRILRSSMIDTLRSEFVTAARARGLREGRILLRYVLRDSLTASVTFIGIAMGTLLSFAVVVEQVFALPGLGSLLVTSVLARDYPTVQSLTLIFAVAVVLANLGADLTYRLLDPRVRL